MKLMKLYTGDILTKIEPKNNVLDCFIKTFDETNNILKIEKIKFNKIKN